MELRKKIFGVAALAFAVALGAGVWSVNAEAEGEAALNGFEITATSVRTADPAGLRFQTVVGANAATTYAEAEAYTTLTLTTGGATYTTTSAVNAWTTDGKGWNTVLLGIPASDYVTEVTAQSFIKVSDTEVYATEAVTSSIAKTASFLMNMGETEEEVTKYTAGAVTAIEVAETAEVCVGATTKLAATTTPAGYGVIWYSSDREVATVAEDGTVTGVKAGTATITATMSGVSATCTVTVEEALPVTVKTAPEVGVGYALFLRQMNKSQTLYFTGSMSGKYYATTQDLTSAARVYVEAAATADAYYMYFVDASGVKQYLTSTSGTLSLATTASTEWTYNAQYNTMVNGGKYLGTYNTYTTISASDVSFAATSFVSHFAKVVKASEVTGEVKAAEEIELLEGRGVYFPATVTTATATYTVPTTGFAYDTVSIEWASDNACAVVNGGTITVTQGNTVQNVTITATLKENGATVGTKTYTFEVPALDLTPVTSDDLSTMNNGKAGTSYGTYTSASGWVAANSQFIYGNQTGLISDTTIGAACLNGKTSTKGTLTSPTLKGGITKLNFNVGLPFSDTKYSIKVEIKDAAGNVLFTDTTTAVNTSAAKNTVYSHSIVVTGVTGDFVIVFTNQSPSNSGSNKDRTAIWNINWTLANA